MNAKHRVSETVQLDRDDSIKFIRSTLSTTTMSQWQLLSTDGVQFTETRIHVCLTTSHPLHSWGPKLFSSKNVLPDNPSIQ